ncbi:helix-turn-helix domain-containing protein [Acidovorax sp. BL-A-41-H1]|uniref:helix-turn-helix domain-containing protein n=1 Tax=Acidovorax sp. BL-A-41-H1 TaxID=3421102 RepID=UPI003F7A8A3D
MQFSAAPLPVDRHALIAQAREALLAQGTAPVRAGVQSWITRSWQRCLANGLSPAQRASFEMVSAPALRRTQEQNRALLDAARPVLAQLTHAISAMRYFSILTDARGIVVDVQGAVDRQDPRASAIGRVGIDLSEAAVGTTAIGAALAELQPVWLHRGEHFLDDNSSYSCAGAPLFGPQGDCIGMLDLTGIDVPERPELRHLVARSARAMEDALLQQQPHALLLRLNWPGCALGGEGDGLLALDADGVVLGGNTAARQLLPLWATSPAAPTHCSDLIALPWMQLFDAARSRSAHAPLDLPLWSGLRLQGLARQPAHAAGYLADLHVPTLAASHPAMRRPGTALEAGTDASLATAPLRQAETALIRRAVQEARGNVAEAARALGISRATVYRKLGTPKGPGRS